MYQKKSRQCCAVMLIVSVCLRICMFLGLDRRLAVLAVDILQKPETAQMLLYLETGQKAELPAPQREIVVIKRQEPVFREEPETQGEIRTVAAEQIVIAGACSYSYDKQQLLAEKSSLDFSGSGRGAVCHCSAGSE